METIANHTGELENTPDFITRLEAAEILGVHPNTVMSWGKRGFLEIDADSTLIKASSVEELRKKIYEEVA